MIVVVVYYSSYYFIMLNTKLKIIDFRCFVKRIGKINSVIFYDVKWLNLSPRTWIREEMGKRKNLFPRTNTLFIVFTVHKYCYWYRIYIDLIS